VCDIFQNFPNFFSKRHFLFQSQNAFGKEKNQSLLTNVLTGTVLYYCTVYSHSLGSSLRALLTGEFTGENAERTNIAPNIVPNAERTNIAPNGVNSEICHS
jgi:hypothetical protein